MDIKLLLYNYKTDSKIRYFATPHIEKIAVKDKLYDTASTLPNLQNIKSRRELFSKERDSKNGPAHVFAFERYLETFLIAYLRKFTSF